MAVTIKGRAGHKVTWDVRYWAPDKTALINTTGFTASLQLRSLFGPRRVLLNVDETDTVGVFQLVEPGHWRITLSPATTTSLPQRTAFEIELVNDLNPQDRNPLVPGVLLLDPQVVANV